MSHFTERFLHDQKVGNIVFSILPWAVKNDQSVVNTRASRQTSCLYYYGSVDFMTFGFFHLPWHMLEYESKQKNKQN